MGLLIVGGIIAIGIVAYFAYCEIRADVFPKLAFKDNENVKLDNVKFEKYYPNNKNL